jgi:hypothetical protein
MTLPLPPVLWIRKFGRQVRDLPSAGPLGPPGTPVWPHHIWRLHRVVSLWSTPCWQVMFNRVHHYWRVAMSTGSPMLEYWLDLPMAQGVSPMTGYANNSRPCWTGLPHQHIARVYLPMDEGHSLEELWSPPELQHGHWMGTCSPTILNLDWVQSSDPRSFSSHYSASILYGLASRLG